MADNKHKAIGLLGLIGLVVGSMIGSGIFNLPSDMGATASGSAILIAWVITAVGMICLGLSFQNLVMRRPDLEGGVFSYAREGFGEYMGFNSAWGYWLSAVIGNVAYVVALLGAVNYFTTGSIDFISENGALTIPGVIAGSVLLWAVHLLITRGVKQATVINVIVTIAKMVPLIVFAIAILIAFNASRFAAGFSITEFMDPDGAMYSSSIMEQVKSTMFATVWVFIGIEGAVVFSSRAKHRSDVGKATIIGLLGVTAIYLLITVVTLGVSTQAELVGMAVPSTAYILQSVVGPWGAVLINIGVIISISGAWLGWTLLASEVPYLAVKQGVFPKYFAKESGRDVPINSLIVSNLIAQVGIFFVFFSFRAYEFGYTMASSAILIPYALSAFYQVKFMLQTKDTKAKVFNLFVGIIASAYAIWLLYGAGPAYMAFTMVLFIIGTFVYIYHRRIKQEKVFTPIELFIALLVTVIGIYGLYMVITGSLELFA